MSQISSERLAESQGAVRTSSASRSFLILAAWTATLLLSNFPLVIARDILGVDIPWMVPAWIVASLLLIAAATVWPPLRPLRRYFIVMGVLMGLFFGIHPVLVQTAAWQALFAGQPEIISVFGTRVLLLVETLIVLSILLLTGVKRQDAFLVVGQLNAPIGGQVSPVRKQPLRWSILGTAAAVLLPALFFTFLASQMPGFVSNLAAAVAWIPLILLAAALNAFVEEASYRAAPLSTLLPAVGPAHALVLTSLWFGLGHYYGGIPSGPVGLVQTGLLAMLLGKAMLDTRGLGWPWIIHVAMDTVIFLGIAAAMG